MEGSISLDHFFHILWYTYMDLYTDLYMELYADLYTNLYMKF